MYTVLILDKMDLSQNTESQGVSTIIPTVSDLARSYNKHRGPISHLWLNTGLDRAYTCLYWSRPGLVPNLVWTRFNFGFHIFH